MYRLVFCRLGTNGGASSFSPYSFAQLDLHASLQASLKRLSFERPTVVQSESFVPISSRRDTVVNAETGSGKTLAYLVPLINRVLFQKEQSSSGFRDILGRSRPPIVVLLPTTQLLDQVHGLVKSLGLSCIEVQRLSADSCRVLWGVADLVLGTPFRFAEDVRQHAHLDGLRPSTIVLDEADLLLEGPTQGDVLDLIEYLRGRCGVGSSRSPSSITQFIFSAATLSHVGPFSAGNMILQRFGQSASWVGEARGSRVSEGVKEVQWVEEGEGDWAKRVDLLTSFLSNRFRKDPAVVEGPASPSCLVFVNSVKNGRILTSDLASRGFDVSLFEKQSKTSVTAPITVCTDLAARGIDWKSVSLVVNFQMPRDVVSWLHRAGRTGRLGGPTGTVASFYKATEGGIVREIQAALGEDLQGGLDKLFSKKRSLSRRLKQGAIEDPKMDNWREGRNRGQRGKTSDNGEAFKKQAKEPSKRD